MDTGDNLKQRKCEVWREQISHHCREWMARNFPGSMRQLAKEAYTCHIVAVAGSLEAHLLTKERDRSQSLLEHPVGLDFIDSYIDKERRIYHTSFRTANRKLLSAIVIPRNLFTERAHEVYRGSFYGAFYSYFRYGSVKFELLRAMHMHLDQIYENALNSIGKDIESVKFISIGNFFRYFDNLKFGLHAQEMCNDIESEEFSRRFGDNTPTIEVEEFFENSNTGLPWSEMHEVLQNKARRVRDFEDRIRHVIVARVDAGRTIWGSLLQLFSLIAAATSAAFAFFALRLSIGG